MPSTKVQLSGGAFQSALGDVVANGYMLMELSQDSQVTGASPEVLITAGRTVKILLDSSGNVDTSTPQYVWPNDLLSPTNTFYIASVYTAQGQLVWGPNAQQVLSSPSPYDIGAWKPNVSNTSAPVTQTIYDIGFYYPGTYTNGQVLLLLKLDRAITFSANLVPSTGVCAANPTASATLTVLKNGSQFATLTFSTGGVATYASSGVAFAAEDTISVVAPASADLTLAGVGMILSGVAV